MSTQVLLDVPDDIYRQVRSVAARTQQAVADVLLDSIARAFAPFPVDPRRAEMSRNVEAFVAIHPTLVKEYLGKTVAILGGHLVDSDADPLALLQRVRRAYPNRVVLRRKVELIAERELQIRLSGLDPQRHSRRDRNRNGCVEITNRVSSEKLGL